ncbi:MAG: HAMP domain-containing protein [Candidatus Aminicenantes bacterium]|nr:HAMP domain-containing protein [Candidatus Aminicenantes bacterium]
MKIKKTRSLIFKLTVWYVVFLSIIIVIIGAIIFGSYRNSLLNELDIKLGEIADELNDAYWRHRGVSFLDAIEKVENEFRRVAPHILIVKIAHDKKNFLEKVIHTGNSYDKNFILSRDLYCRSDRSDLNPLYVTWDEGSMRSSHLRVILFPVKRNTILQIGLSLKSFYSRTSQVLILVALSGILFLVLASAGGNFIIRKALLPVVNVAQTANQISTDDLSHRIETKKRTDEIGVLVETFNEMITRLDKSVKKIKRFSGDVSHELRTPLTNIRGEIEVSLRKERAFDEYKKTLNSVLEETHHMEKIIDDLLLLSRTESLNKETLTEEVSLDEVLLQVYERFEQPASKKNIHLNIKKVTPVTIKGQKALIARLFSNLIDNALQYTKEGGRVDLSLNKDREYGILKISDTGIGIPEESIPFVFDRFYVVEQSRSKESGGVGLGLSIVKRIVDIHGAVIHIQSQMNKGTDFEIRFPLNEKSP